MLHFKYLATIMCRRTCLISRQFDRHSGLKCCTNTWTWSSESRGCYEKSVKIFISGLTLIANTSTALPRDLMCFTRVSSGSRVLARCELARQELRLACQLQKYKAYLQGSERVRSASNMSDMMFTFDLYYPHLPKS